MTATTTTEYRIVFDDDLSPDFSYLEDWVREDFESETEYEYATDPRNYSSYWVEISKVCPCCGQLESDFIDGVGGCDFYHWGKEPLPDIKRAYLPEYVKEKWPWIYEHFAHVVEGEHDAPST